MLQLKIENFLFFLLQYLKGTIDSISSSVLYFESLSIQKLSFCGWRFVTTYISSYSFRYKHCFRPFDLWRVIMISHQRETFMTRYWHKLYFGAMSLQKRKVKATTAVSIFFFGKLQRYTHTDTRNFCNRLLRNDPQCLQTSTKFLQLSAWQLEFSKHCVAFYLGNKK